MMPVYKKRRFGGGEDERVVVVVVEVKLDANPLEGRFFEGRSRG